MDQWDKEFPDTYAYRIDMTRKEQTAVFQSMLICIMIQVCSVYLIVQEFSTVEFNNDRYLLLIPKLISCFYMHNILSGEVKDGMQVMKYTINHPEMFEREELGEAKDGLPDMYDGKYARMTYGFLIGFIQWSIAVTLEFMSIFFLNSLTSYRLIIVCYASLTCVANFDNMFARALDGHPIKEAAGCMLRVSYHRYMDTEINVEKQKEWVKDGMIL